MNKRIAIVNARAGARFKKRQHETWLSKLSNTNIVFTERPGHGSEIAREAFSSGIRDYIVCGGDGTVFEVVNGLYPEAFGSAVRMGIFPGGTGNSMLRDFSKSPEQTIEAIESGRTKPCDVCELVTDTERLFFTNLVSLGFVARVGEIRNRMFSRLGDLGYVCSVLYGLPTLTTTTLVTKQMKHSEWTFLSFNNTKCTGGAMMIAPSADPQDGMITTVCAKKLSRMDLLRAFPKIYRGTHVQHPDVEEKPFAQLTFSNTERQPIMIDGEMKHGAPQSLQAHHHALEIFA